MTDDETPKMTPAERMDLARARAHEAMAARRAAGMSGFKSPVERLAEKPTSKALAIAAKCFDCVGGHEADHGWRNQVRSCPAKSCPLHAVRPCQAATDIGDEGEAAAWGES